MTGQEHDAGLLPGRRGLRAVAGTCVLAGLLGTWPVHGAAASCTAPTLAVGAPPEHGPEPAPAVVVLGSRPTVTGDGFMTGCDDTGQGSGCRAPASEQEPMRDVALVLEQGGVSVVLATADAGQDDVHGILWHVRVPTRFRPGPATLSAAGASLPVELRAP